MDKDLDRRKKSDAPKKVYEAPTLTALSVQNTKSGSGGPGEDPLFTFLS